MSPKIQQLTAHQSRLDVALSLNLIPMGTRFLYTVNGSGKCYEATLYEISPEGHVRLNNEGYWDWPPEIRIEEILPPAPTHPAPIKAPTMPIFSVPPAALPGAPDSNPAQPAGEAVPLETPNPKPETHSAKPLPFAKTTTPKPKRYT